MNKIIDRNRNWFPAISFFDANKTFEIAQRTMKREEPEPKIKKIETYRILKNRDTVIVYIERYLNVAHVHRHAQRERERMGGTEWKKERDSHSTRIGLKLRLILKYNKNSV